MGNDVQADQYPLPIPTIEKEIILKKKTPQSPTKPFSHHRHDSGRHHHHNRSPMIPRRKRGLSHDGERDDYGWFEDFESPHMTTTLSQEFARQPLQKALSLPPPATEPPLYILESSLETQQLWYSTAGRRPKQPPQERAYYEQLWAKNFESSSVPYLKSEEVLDNLNIAAITHNNNNLHRAATLDNNNINNIMVAPSKKRMKPINIDKIPTTEIQGEILFRGRAPFSNAVSKSFLNDDLVSSMTLHMPFFRIVRGLKSQEIYAEYLMVVSLGSTVPVTFGIWKRFSDFQQLAQQLIHVNTISGVHNDYKNAVLSWQCVLQRKRWFKSLDKEYLALKCFLLERFMHDVLFESQSSVVLSKFFGLHL
jgi:hypothetical protein